MATVATWILVALCWAFIIAHNVHQHRHFRRLRLESEALLADIAALKRDHEDVLAEVIEYRDKEMK